MMQKVSIEVWTCPLLQGTLSAALLLSPSYTPVDSPVPPPPAAEHALLLHVIKDPNFHPLFTPYKFTSLLQNLLQRYAKQAGVAVRILVLLAIIAIQMS